jgi:hypothetical protein
VEAPAFTATLQGVELPEQVRATGAGLSAPEVTLKVSAATGRAIEVGYRLDGNGWHGFVAPLADGTLRMRDPALLLQGHHALELRARFADAPQGIGAGPTLGVTIDLEAPTLQLEADRAHGRLLVHARDQVTADERLSFSFKVGDGAWSEPGPLRLVDLQAIEAAGGLGVRVRDEAGREREARWAVARVATREAAETSGTATGTAGCSAAPTGLTAAALALSLLSRKRSRRGAHQREAGYG